MKALLAIYNVDQYVIEFLWTYFKLSFKLFVYTKINDDEYRSELSRRGTKRLTSNTSYFLSFENPASPMFIGFISEKVEIRVLKRDERGKLNGKMRKIAYPTGDVNVYDFEEISRSSNLEERLTTEQIGELKELLHKHKTVFSNKPGKTHLVEHDIELISNQPVRSKPYRTSQRQAEILKSEIKQMLDLKIIEMGQSDYTSPMLLVEAPGKAPRPCIDYRKLNSVIKTEYFLLPNLEERVERVSAAKFITALDLAKGYWQIPMTKNASRLAAFVTNFGTYLPLRMPFGLVNAPYFFSKMMAEILGNCERYAVPYLDDIAIYSETWEEHLKHVDEVLKRIGAANLTVKPSKCQLAQSRTKYLGHMVGDGVRTPAEAKIKAVIDFPTPKQKLSFPWASGLLRTLCGKIFCHSRTFNQRIER
ncbi:Transposon Ty3-I Gag-Pol polyprotein like [Argiope bruennichi]|uniref:Transposon Ty3-I Gag-Pol polyprotein like n=1 Tax=Argiope bruennichi TaxID=94029 RepID=A0A8T0F729_ARGBR|nr:Transposon Ty3-I Gag-Pol polyprotein like [Argiope bruennichi]